LLGVILELTAALAGGGGQPVLQAGQHASLALSRALSTLAIGLATSAVCFSASSILRRRAAAAMRDLEMTIEVLEASETPA
jgi:biopolymer transport protein ExbB/TolQ